MGDSAQRNRRDFAYEVAKRREAAEREQEQRRESLLREREERQQRLEKRREEERREKDRRNHERELRRQKIILDRRCAQLEKEEARKQAILQKTHAKASRVAAVQKPKPVYAFGSSTPRELSFLERLPPEQKIYDRRLTPSCGPTPPPTSPITTPVRQNRKADMSRSLYSGPSRNRTSTANSTLCVASATRSAPHPPSSMTQSMYVASKSPPSANNTPKGRLPVTRRNPVTHTPKAVQSPKPPIPATMRSRRLEQPAQSTPVENKKPPPIRPPPKAAAKTVETNEEPQLEKENVVVEKSISPEPIVENGIVDEPVIIKTLEDEPIITIETDITMIETAVESPLSVEENFIEQKEPVELEVELEEESKPVEEGEIPQVVSIIDDVLNSEAEIEHEPEDTVEVEEHDEKMMGMDVEVVESERMATFDSPVSNGVNVTLESEDDEDPKTETISRDGEHKEINGVLIPEIRNGEAEPARAEMTAMFTVDDLLDNSISESRNEETGFSSPDSPTEKMSVSLSATDISNANEKMTTSVTAVSMQIEKERQERAQRMARVNELLAKTRNGSKLTISPAAPLASGTGINNGNISKPVTEESPVTPVNGETTTTVENQQNGFASAKAPTPPLILNQKPILDGISLSSSTAKALQRLQLMRNGGLNGNTTPQKKIEPVSLAEEFSQLNIGLPGTPDHYPPEDPHVRAVTQS
ncbi:hypothetical protein L596_007781 [Steinernema carpocapsae]|uniref:Uncharacterized protein n=1 Tax=Steinernema carpocapsae TaxID=34508 RepID=A0A4U5PAI0_STECR|nr:hypothetical protein L596_007781 [Steinernema carpocapsae]